MLLMLLEMPASVEGIGSLLTEGRLSHTTPRFFEHILGAAAVLCGLTAILVCICVGWYLAWLTSLKDIQFFQELLGRSRQPAGKFTPEQLQAEIARIKAQHRTGSSFSSSHSSSKGIYSRAHRMRSSEERQTRHSLSAPSEQHNTFRDSTSGPSEMHYDHISRSRHSSSNPSSRRASTTSVSPRSLSDTHGAVL